MAEAIDLTELSSDSSIFCKEVSQDTSCIFVPSHEELDTAASVARVSDDGFASTDEQNPNVDDTSHACVIIGETLGMRWNVDLMHKRTQCGLHAFDVQPNVSNAAHCHHCFCWVCDMLASKCSFWGQGAEVVDHCNAHDTVQYRSLRLKFRRERHASAASEAASVTGKRACRADVKKAAAASRKVAAKQAAARSKIATAVSRIVPAKQAVGKSKTPAALHTTSGE